MLFELVAWMIITLVCFGWGILLTRIILQDRNDIVEFPFPVSCFLGLLAMGIVIWYFSLWYPIRNGIKILIAAPAVFFYLSAGNRRIMKASIRVLIQGFNTASYALTGLSLIMILLLGAAPMNHPDSLNYHIYSILFYDRYSVIPGIANLKPEFGFQSLWFATSEFFDFSFSASKLYFPLNGCFLSWVILYIISKTSYRTGEFSGSDNSLRTRMPSFLLLLIILFSWTQVRLTASSLSPDFVASVSVLLSFYYLMDGFGRPLKQHSLYFSVFFAVAAAGIKLSVVVILIVPFFVIVYGISKKKYRLAMTSFFLSCLVILPLFARNFISSGYPLFPSFFADLWRRDWKFPAASLARFQHYITGYARFPISREDAEKNFELSLKSWLPRWWEHLYAADKFLLFMIVFGFILDLVFFNIWRKWFTKAGMIVYFIALTGFLVWITGAPDPRFGTGFLYTLIYFQYAPLLSDQNLILRHLPMDLKSFKWGLSFFIFIYIGFRTVRFFEIGDLLLPQGVTLNSAATPDCGELRKTMMLEGGHSPADFPDSCRSFFFRGKYLKDGFRPLN